MYSIWGWLRSYIGTGSPRSSSSADMGRRRRKLTVQKGDNKSVQPSCATATGRVCNLHEPEMMTCNRFMTPVFLVCNLQILVSGGPHGLQGGGKHL